MDCSTAKAHLAARRKNALEEDARAELDAHLEGCEACRHEAAAEDALTGALDRLPPRRASAALTRSLEAQVAAFSARSRTTRTEDLSRAATSNDARRVGPYVAFAAGVALAAIVLLSVGVFGASASFGRTAESRDAAGRSDPMVAEAINDHLRVLYSEHPLEVESGGVHQVKPWFAGRLDFAPVVAFGGDDDFPLQGGSVAYFLDRKAAAYQYKRRLHPITLFVFRADRLTWAAPTQAIGHARGTVDTQRGFHTVMWHENDLGYALVSDLDDRELLGLAAKIAGP